MKKRTYITPLAESISVVAERLMEVASPGVGGGYNPDNPIDGKMGVIFLGPKGEKRCKQR